MTREEAVEYFVEAKVPIAPVYNVDDVVKDKHLIERDMLITVNHAQAGPIKVVNFPVKFSQTPVKILHAAPVIGQHNREVLREILNYDDEQIETLKRVNAISR
jgi:crotonobetainyl-CoA:carnitine CoA-transferase CaiB-like acyl-CoA transferase